MTRAGTPGAAGRLVARARRPAVRAREELVDFQVTEMAEAVPAAVSAVPAVGRLPERPRTSSSPASQLGPRQKPAVIDVPAPQPVQTSAPAPAAPAPVYVATPQPSAARASATVAAALTRDEIVEPGPPPPALDEAGPERPSADTTPEAPGWQGLAEPEPEVPVRASELEPAAVPQAPPVPLEPREPATRAVDGPSSAVAPAAAPRARPVERAASVVPTLPGPVAAPELRAAAPAAPLAPEPPPQVLIERIEVITPPAPAPARDPFASLASRRAAASRHGRAG